MSSRLPSLRDRFAGAETFDAFVARAEHYPELWRDMRARARVPDDLVDRARRLAAPRHFLVLLEDWCGDAVNTISAVAALADAVPTFDLRVLARDEHPDLMNARLTNGTRSIPRAARRIEAGEPGTVTAVQLDIGGGGI